ncbi:hypothetical protein KLP42_19160 [Rhizobium sp. CSW-27]|nr:hypothetical protein [Rhizobium sp. CSW-27]
MRTGIYALMLIIGPAETMAQAQTSPPGPEALPRYRLERTEHGFIRLDQQTGAVSSCREETTGLVCRLAADERAAWEQELDMLARRVAALEARAGRPEDQAPAEADIERSLSIMERFMRRFMNLIEEFRGHETPQPDRT